MVLIDSLVKLILLVNAIVTVQLANGQVERESDVDRFREYAIKLMLDSRHGLHSTKSRTSTFDSDLRGIEIDYLKYKILKLVSRFDKLLNYFESDYRELNVDGLFGVRIAENIFVKLSRQLNVTDDSSRFLLNFASRVDELSRRVSKMAQAAYVAVEEDTPDYSKAFENLIRTSFGLNTEPVSIRKTLATLKNQKELRENFDEKLSDLCYSQLLDVNTKCHVDSDCLDYYAYNKASGYYLTHQLLFFIIGDYNNCSLQVYKELLAYLKQHRTNELFAQIVRNNQIADVNTRKQLVRVIRKQIFKYYCARIYPETLRTYETYLDAKSIPLDLYLEQLVLCGIANVQEFMSNKWLEAVYPYQSTSGCFKFVDDRSDIMDDTEAYENFLKYLSTDKNYNKRVHMRKINKREDRVMENGCSSHTSGLAFAYFSLMIRENFYKLTDLMF